MSKLLRRYKQQILVVGVCLLMIAWLFPQAMQQFGQGGISRTLAHYKGGKITGSQWRDAQREVMALSGINIILPSALGLMDQEQRLAPWAVEHWLLLCHEAERAGMAGGEANGRELLARLSNDIASNPMVQYRAFGQMMDAAAVRDILEKARASAVVGAGSAQFVDRALGKASGILRMLATSRSLGASLSSKEAALYGWQRFDSVIADIALVPPTSVSAELTPPDDARIAEHFEKHRGIRAVQSDDGVGYLREPAVRVEWLSIARQSIIDSTPADPVEVNKFWRQNKAAFGEDDFSKAKAAAEAEYKKLQAAKLIERAVEAINRVTLRSMSGVSDQGRYKKLPEDWASKQPTLEVYAEAARAALGTPDARGLVVVTTDDGVFRTDAELRRLPGIGRASGRIAQLQNAQFADACMIVKELGHESPAGIQTGILYGPLSEPLGQNDFYFRVTAARPEGPPESSAEVLDRIKADIAFLDGMALLTSRAESYKAMLVDKGVAGLLGEISGIKSALDVEITRDALRSADPSKLMPLTEADTDTVRSAVMSAVEAWDPRTEVSSLDASARALVIPDARARGLVLVQIKARRPLTEEKLAESDSEVMNLARREVLMTGARFDPFAWEQLSQRLNFKSVIERKSEEPGESSPPAEPKRAG